MKGPRSRTRFFIWRQWECPACGRKIWTSGKQTLQPCFCAGAAPREGPLMHLLEPRRKRGYFNFHGEAATTPPPADGGVS